ncbi:MAG TPA: hypothetical protein VNA12_02375 [Mycobacteriales bacterium]|nr:hypothetical protein [Mycobacteriales bacterium]
MNRILVAVLSLGLIVASGATADAKRRPTRVERVVEGRYEAYPAPVTGCNEPLGNFACLIVETRANETYFTAKVTDTHGQPVFFEVRSEQDDSYMHFCGETSEPIAIAPRTRLHVFVALNGWGIAGGCMHGRVKTTGTIRVTLANLP